MYFLYEMNSGTKNTLLNNNVKNAINGNDNVNPLELKSHLLYRETIYGKYIREEYSCNHYHGCR